MHQYFVRTELEICVVVKLSILYRYNSAIFESKHIICI